LLDVIGIEAPAEIDGVAQRPIEGVSFASTLADAGAPATHLTQYYEMFGSRALYHDGWKAVAFHPMLAINYGDGRDPFAPFDADEWELYHVAEDLSEVDDLASEHPEKLKEMIELWWDEAERYQALPLNNQPARYNDRRHRRDRYVFYPGTGSLPESVAPNLRNRPFHIIAELDVPEDGRVEGVIVCHGGPTGGYSLYAKGNRIHYVNNLLGADVTTVSSSVDLPAGQIRARVVFTPTDRFAGDVALYYDDLPVGEGHIARTTPISYGVEGFSVGYQRGGPVSEDYDGRFAFTPGALRRVVVEGMGEPYRDVAAEQRAALAQQ
jgi:arylsulfatase